MPKKLRTRKQSLSSNGSNGHVQKLPEAMKKYQWKPGQPSPNPGGRPKKLGYLLEKYLDRKDEKGVTFAERLIEAAVKRAIKNSDAMTKEIFERVDGHVPYDPAQAAQFGVKVIIVDSIPSAPSDFDWEAAEREDDENDS